MVSFLLYALSCSLILLTSAAVGIEGRGLVAGRDQDSGLRTTWASTLSAQEGNGKTETLSFLVEKSETIEDITVSTKHRSLLWFWPNSVPEGPTNPVNSDVSKEKAGDEDVSPSGDIEGSSPSNVSSTRDEGREGSGKVTSSSIREDGTVDKSFETEENDEGKTDKEDDRSDKRSNVKRTRKGPIGGKGKEGEDYEEVTEDDARKGRMQGKGTEKGGNSESGEEEEDPEDPDSWDEKANHQSKSTSRSETKENQGGVSGEDEDGVEGGSEVEDKKDVGDKVKNESLLGETEENGGAGQGDSFRVEDVNRESGSGMDSNGHVDEEEGKGEGEDAESKATKHTSETEDSEKTGERSVGNENDKKQDYDREDNFRNVANKTVSGSEEEEEGDEVGTKSKARFGKGSDVVEEDGGKGEDKVGINEEHEAGTKGVREPEKSAFRGKDGENGDDNGGERIIDGDFQKSVRDKSRTGSSMDQEEGEDDEDEGGVDSEGKFETTAGSGTKKVLGKREEGGIGGSEGEKDVENGESKDAPGEAGEVDGDNSQTDTNGDSRKGPFSGEDQKKKYDDDNGMDPEEETETNVRKKTGNKSPESEEGEVEKSYANEDYQSGTTEEKSKGGRWGGPKSQGEVEGDKKENVGSTGTKVEETNSKVHKSGSESDNDGEGYEDGENVSNELDREKFGDGQRGKDGKTQKVDDRSKRGSSTDEKEGDKGEDEGEEGKTGTGEAEKEVDQLGGRKGPPGKEMDEEGGEGGEGGAPKGIGGGHGKGATKGSSREEEEGGYGDDGEDNSESGQKSSDEDEKAWESKSETNDKDKSPKRYSGDGIEDMDLPVNGEDKKSQTDKGSDVDNKEVGGDDSGGNIEGRSNHGPPVSERGKGENDIHGYEASSRNGTEGSGHDSPGSDNVAENDINGDKNDGPGRGTSGGRSKNRDGEQEGVNEEVGSNDTPGYPDDKKSSPGLGNQGSKPPPAQQLTYIVTFSPTEGEYILTLTNNAATGLHIRLSASTSLELTKHRINLAPFESIKVRVLTRSKDSKSESSTERGYVFGEYKGGSFKVPLDTDVVRHLSPPPFKNVDVVYWESPAKENPVEEKIPSPTTKSEDTNENYRSEIPKVVKPKSEKDPQDDTQEVKEADKQQDEPDEPQDDKQKDTQEDKHEESSSPVSHNQKGSFQGTIWEPIMAPIEAFISPYLTLKQAFYVAAGFLALIFSFITYLCCICRRKSRHIGDVSYQELELNAKPGPDFSMLLGQKTEKSRGSRENGEEGWSDDWDEEWEVEEKKRESMKLLATNGEATDGSRDLPKGDIESGTPERPARLKNEEGSLGSSQIGGRKGNGGGVTTPRSPGKKKATSKLVVSKGKPVLEEGWDKEWST